MNGFGLIGDPLGHSLSPALYRELFRRLKLQNSFKIIKVKQEKLEAFVKENTLQGYNVTIPHKETIIPFLEQLSPEARIMGAVNCINKSPAGTVGHNTDWLGFKTALNINKVDVTGKKCLILGAGGAAKAIIYALIKMGAGFIRILNRHYERGLLLSVWAQKLSRNGTEAVLLENINFREIDIIINCTPVGMWPAVNASPLNPEHINRESTLIDTVYNPLDTKWLRAGREKGALTLGGLDMFIHQGLASLKIWNPGSTFEKIDLDQLEKALIWDLQ
ncbi:MAG: shikimate dehydrogenase [Candidatus Neomarinimicrobiota bacterium]